MQMTFLMNVNAWLISMATATVNIHDLLNLISQWGATSTPKDPLQEDLDGDGAVDVTDLMIVISQFGDC